MLRSVIIALVAPVPVELANRATHQPLVDEDHAIEPLLSDAVQHKRTQNPPSTRR